MTDIFRDIKASESFKSPQVGLFIAELDDQNRRLLEDLKDITPAELEWQSAPGMNTIGMLLAHIAIVEAWWMHVGPLAKGSTEAAAEPLPGIIGMGFKDDGLPIERAGGLPAPNLAGKDLAFYENALQRARNFTKEITVYRGPYEYSVPGADKDYTPQTEAPKTEKLPTTTTTVASTAHAH